MQTNGDSKPRPVAPASRLHGLDTLRGFALLGILVMNIISISMPEAAYFSPTGYAPETPGNFVAWAFSYLFFDLKFLAIFSMLFGAGLLLMYERAETVGKPLTAIYYRRIFWLFVIGMLHAWLLWYGDILVTYAICGVFLYLFRRRSVRALVINGFVFLIIGALLSTGGGLAQNQLRNVVQEINAKVAAGEEMTPRRQDLVDQWEELRREFEPTAEENEEIVRVWRGGVADVLEANAQEAALMQIQALPFFLFWRAMALMLFGMALLKSGVLKGERSRGYYTKWILAGIGLGLPLTVVGMWMMHRHDYDFVSRFMLDGQFNYFGSIFVSMAYISGLTLLHQGGKLKGIQTRLAAVGRMALTNYLLQSAICAVIFYGYGFGLFGQVGRLHLWWFVLGIWFFQLLISPWWLNRFHFGPVEWLWRCLTYHQIQAMRKTSGARN